MAVEKPYHVPWYNRLSRSIALPLFRTIFSHFSRIEVDGMENIPLRQPYLLVFNHVSLFEAPIIGAYWPEGLEVLGAHEVWERPGQGLLARIYGGIPIRRGEVDRTAIRRMVDVLRSGQALMLAPEGTRSQKPGMQIGKPGVMYVYEKKKVPFVPVGMVGTTVDFLSNLLHGKNPQAQMHIGKPFFLPEGLGTGQRRSEVYKVQVDYVMHRLAELLPLAYRGVYS